jgi:hypothetical protein
MEEIKMIEKSLKIINEEIELHEESIEKLTQIPWKTDLDNYAPEDRMNDKIRLFNNNYMQTKKEVVGRFTYSEALFLVLAFGNTGYQMIGIDNKKELVETLNHYKDHLGKGLIEDNKLICIINKNQQEFSMDSLIDKIEKMTQFQCFTIASIAFDVLVKMKQRNIINFVRNRATEIIREAFGISYED